MTSNHTLGHLANRRSHGGLYADVHGRFIHHSGQEMTQMSLSGEAIEQALVRASTSQQRKGTDSRDGQQPAWTATSITLSAGKKSVANDHIQDEFIQTAGVKWGV